MESTPKFGAGEDQARVKRQNPSDVPVAVVGLGLMGTSMIACLLAAGHHVIGLSRNPDKHRDAADHIRGLLEEMRDEGLLRADVSKIVSRFCLSGDYSALSDRSIVFETIAENMNAKLETISRIEAAVSPEAVIGSNTSAIPVTLLQQGASHPDRILGIHWGEPAHVSRFLEVICGDNTNIRYAERVVALAQFWSKEPTLVKRDVRGFITNRLMYALMREAFFLVEEGYATYADVDRSFRNDLGYWATFAGPFRFMDITGIPAYAMVMEDLFPDLHCGKSVPASMKQMVESGALGVRNAKGFYEYTPEEAANWEKLFLKFSYEVRALSAKYPWNAGSIAKDDPANAANAANSD
jgi:3-hydroxybutyryl-CoA dehydrogenase